MSKETRDAITLAVSIFGAATGLIGTVLGVTGTVLGVLNYLRDRAKVIVRLEWDIHKETDPISPQQYWGLVTVTNVGRRPVYISHVAIKFPSLKNAEALLLLDSVAGKKLSEGDPPEVFYVKEDTRYALHWKKVRATVQDSTGRIYYSNRTTKQPNWGKS